VNNELTINGLTTQQTAQAVDAWDNVKRAFLFVSNPKGNANAIGGTERAIISFVAIVGGLSLFGPTRKYAIYAGAVILVLWGEKLYKQFSGAN
jgi:hypothetical protein